MSVNGDMFVTFKSLMCRYSSIMAFDFFSTSASVMAGFGRGGVGAFSRLTADRKESQYNISTQHHTVSWLLQFLTWEVFAWTPVPTSSVSASPVPVVSHAGNTTHRLIRVPVVSAPPATFLRLSAEASLGDLVLSASVIPALPSLTAIKSVKPIPLTIAPVAITAGA